MTLNPKPNPMNLIRTILGPPTDRPFVIVLYGIVALLVLAIYASADEYICESDAGCKALQSTDNGTREVTFKKGDIIDTGGGWIVTTSDGWRSLDLAWRNRAIAGLLPL